MHDVGENSCELREYVHMMNIDDWRGHVYYELTDEEECISKENEIIIWNKLKVMLL